MAFALSQLQECYGAMARRPRYQSPGGAPDMSSAREGVIEGNQRLPQTKPRLPSNVPGGISRQESSVLTKSPRGPACTCFRHLFDYWSAGRYPE